MIDVVKITAYDDIAAAVLTVKKCCLRAMVP